MVRSSKLRRPVAVARFRLLLTQGGDATLTDLGSGEVVWSSAEDELFEEEFGEDFLQYDDVADILDYLESTGELTPLEADACEIHEEFMTPADYAGLLRP